MHTDATATAITVKRAPMVVATAVCADLHRQRPKRTGAAQPALDLWVSGGRQCKPKGYAKGKLVNKQSRRCFRAPAVVDLPSPGKLSTPAHPSPPRGGGRQAPERCRAKAGALLERYHTADRELALHMALAAGGPVPWVYPSRHPHMTVVLLKPGVRFS